MMAQIRRVFISHTSEFSTYPEKRSFVDAAKAAVNRAGCVPCDMEYFTARDQKPAQYCIDRVRECDVYVGIIGLRYGSTVRDRPEVSYTELEFEAASISPAKTRLIFLLDPDALVPASRFTDSKYGERQEKFRQQLRAAGIMCKPFNDFHELDKLIYQALKEEAPVTSGRSQSPEDINWPEKKSPYPGLVWFDEEYAPLFFGRDREVNELIDKMSQPEGRVLLVVGASGSGKSSVLAAGVWQAIIKQGRLPGSTHWLWQRIQPSDDIMPWDAVARGLKDAFQLAARPKLMDRGATLRDLLSRSLSPGQELVLFVDQLEELFTQGFEESNVHTFLDQLIDIAQDSNSRLRLVASVRSEFLGKLEAYESTLNLLNSPYRYHLGPVSPRMLQEMIEKPAGATKYKYSFEPGLVERILNDAGQEPGTLPLVAYSLKQLFEKRKGPTFTVEAYVAIGGVAGAIATKAKEVLSALTENVQGAFDIVFAELVHLERVRPPTRSRARLSSFSSEQAAVQLIEALAGQDCRVLVTSGSGQEAIVEVAHEKLFSEWPTLRDWIAQSGEDLRLIEHEEEEAWRWYKDGARSDELWKRERAENVKRALLRFKRTPTAQLEAMTHPQKMLIERLNDAALPHQGRWLIGQKLAEFGDTREGVGTKNGVPDIKWIKIPGGRVKVNLDKVGWEDISSEFTVKPFHIAKYSVTNAQFEAFLKADDGYGNEEWWKDIEQSHEALKPKRAEANAPREMVCWYEAVAFCRWLSARTATSIRLPTEWEWQHAATSCDPQREYPWQGGWNDYRCNSGESDLNQTTAVGMYPTGATQQGVDDMAGNIYQWCQNKHSGFEQRDALSIDKLGMRAFRGSCFDDNIAQSSQTLKRFCDIPDTRLPRLGFRLAQDLET